MKNEKIMDAVRTLRQMCAEQTDCAHCPFGRDNGTCKITGIPQSWDSDFGDDHSAGTGKKVGTPTDTPTEIYTPTDTPTTRAGILDAAKKIVTGDREKQYGKPEDNFAIIAELWGTYTGYKFSPVDVAMMMALLKVARIKTGVGTVDSFVDLAGYAACAGEIAGRGATTRAQPAGDVENEEVGKQSGKINDAQRAE